MQRVYSQMTNVPATLLIFSGEKLQAPGYRWAPRTLLGRRESKRNSLWEDHTIRHHQLGIRVPDSYHVFLLKPVEQIYRLGHTDWTKFEWGKSSVQRIFFKSPHGTIYFLQLPVDVSTVWSGPKSVTITTHDTLSHSLAVVGRGVPNSSWLPSALVAVTTVADGKARLSPSPEKPVPVDGGAVVDLDFDLSDDTLMPDGRSTWGQARRDFRQAEARLQIGSHILTDYIGWAR